MAYFNLPFGVRIAGTDPIDGDRYIAVDIAARDSLVPSRAGEGQQCYVESEKVLYILKGVTNADWSPIDTGGGGIGDVVGPSGAIDERIAVFNGITGKLIKDGGKTIAELLAGGGATPATIVATVGSGDIDPGDSIVAGTDLEAFINQLVAPILNATIGQMNYVTFGTVATETKEIGEIISITGTSVYNLGIIKSLNPVADVALTGISIGSTFSGTGISAAGVINTPTLAGVNVWTVTEDYAAGVAPYYKSDGSADHSLDGFRVSSSVVDNSNVITGKYRYWYGIGTAPTDSAGVRALITKGFFPVGSFTMNIPAGTAVNSFYLPSTHGTVTVTYTESSNADVTGSFSTIAMNVNDGGGTSVGYDRFETTIGGGGYPQNATYVVTIS